jgi:hypothetical protein
MAELPVPSAVLLMPQTVELIPSPTSHALCPIAAPGASSAASAAPKTSFCEDFI